MAQTLLRLLRIMLKLISDSFYHQHLVIDMIVCSDAIIYCDKNFDLAPMSGRKE